MALLYWGGIVEGPAKTSIPWISEGGGSLDRSGIESGSASPSIITRYQHGAVESSVMPGRWTGREPRVDMANTPVPYGMTFTEAAPVSISQVETGFRFSISSDVMV